MSFVTNTWTTSSRAALRLANIRRLTPAERAEWHRNHRPNMWVRLTLDARKSIAVHEREQQARRHLYLAVMSRMQPDFEPRPSVH